MKRVAVISHWGFKSLHGGNLRAYFLIRELLEQGVGITVLLADRQDVEHTRSLFGCDAVSVDEPMSRWDPMRKKIVKYLIFGRKIRQHLNRHSYDAVFGVNLVQALPAVRQRRSPAWILYVDLWADFFAFDAKQTTANRIFARTIRWAEFYTMKKADKLIMITRCMRDLCHPKLARKAAVIPDGADTQRFYPEATPQSLGKYGMEACPVFSYQGGIARHEGLDLLCRAAPYVLRRLPRAKFLIVGRGDFAEHCRHIVAENGSRDAFVFTGWIDYTEMPGLLTAVDVSVVPMPNVRAARPIISFKLLEAMASGTLVVANRLPGLSEIVNEEMVVLTEADNPEKFGADLVKAYNLPQAEKQRLVENALTRVRALDWRTIAKRDANHFLAGKETLPTSQRSARSKTKETIMTGNLS